MYIIARAKIPIYKMIVYIYKGIKVLLSYTNYFFGHVFTFILFYLNGVKFKSFKSNGYLRVNIGLGSECIIGKNFRSNNVVMSNPIGRFSRCSIIVGNKGKLIIGDNVGMSSTAIVCHKLIEIGDNVQIGGNVVIYDTDFHSLNASHRNRREMDVANTKPVKIGNNSFIGAHSTILKGVSIGENSIVGACSVVTKTIPDNEIWAGNPAAPIRKISQDHD